MPAENKPVYSMTGYATAQATAHGWVACVEVRSVNHRNLDARLFVPRECAWMEPELLKMIRQRVQRGRVELRLKLRRDEPSGHQGTKLIDSARFDRVCQELRQLAAAHQLGGNAGQPDLVMSDVLRLYHLMEAVPNIEIDRDNPAVSCAVDSALDGLIEARGREGAGIAADLGAHLGGLREHLASLTDLLPQQMSAFRARLHQRVERALAEFSSAKIDEARLAQEIAYYADKSDVCEELQRASSHVDRLQALLDGGNEAISGHQSCGKQIDFYLQELIRETNTMGSKSSASRGTDLIIAMKTLVERMREQAANIE